MRKRDPEATRLAILEAAVVAYNNNGYARSTAEEITRIAGVSKGSLYWHFKGKEQVFLELMSSWVDSLFELFQNIRYEDWSTEEKLRYMLEQSLQNPGKNIVYLSTEFWNQHESNAEAIQRLQQIYGRYQEMFRELLFDGMVRNEFKTINIEQLTASFMGMIEGIFSHHLLKNRDQLASKKAFVTGVEIFLDGIRNPGKEHHEEVSKEDREVE